MAAKTFQLVSHYLKSWIGDHFDNLPPGVQLERKFDYYSRVFAEPLKLNESS